MWEFSLNFKADNEPLASQVHKSLMRFISNLDGIVTSHNEENTISILVAVQDEYREEAENALISLITDVICNNFKSDFLNKYLVLPELDEASINAFKKALLNFDRETDRFIIKKNLELQNNLYIESFYNFKLRALHSKWEELVCLSNENKEYLISRDSFIDLLKFLVDNLDICEEEISVVKEEDGYRIYTESEGVGSLISEDRMVSSVIDLSPQKINLYFSEMSGAINLLERIFDERISVNSSGMQNIKKIELNIAK